MVWPGPVSVVELLTLYCAHCLISISSTKTIRFRDEIKCRRQALNEKRVNTTTTHTHLFGKLVSCWLLLGTTSDSGRMKSILITGCNRGLGLGLVKALTALPKPPQHLFTTCRNLEKATVSFAQSCRGCESCTPFQPSIKRHQHHHRHRNYSNII